MHMSILLACFLVCRMHTCRPQSPEEGAGSFGAEPMSSTSVLKTEPSLALLYVLFFFFFFFFKVSGSLSWP